ncbi:Amino Acid/Auxin Permease (AAAP) Family [Thraustotheca clavata]|uniref:Amino Acid/Auxin Permease (AAAP) Family n=1 Tax=Thraustotheca clavata TaxID=74557 RepID=A0A1V9YSQ6_9STRA|nr:Amino Acid/Auxin Permease (AAAP) Family [Thraustotheca clavata]
MLTLSIPSNIELLIYVHTLVHSEFVDIMGNCLTLEDLKICFSLFCCVYGVGTLGMPGNYARAGPAWATVALVFMAIANIYASVCMSKVMLKAPASVKTFGDMGEWCMGPFGRWIAVISQLLVCVMIPMVFLVLGGILLMILFPNSYDQTTWICLMGVSLLPVCLIPTLKEGAGAAAAGAIGTLLADAIALYLLVSNMTPKTQTLFDPELSFKGVVSVFGNLSLAYGAGIIIPALQREHSDPTRMPRCIIATLVLISVLFFVISVTGYSVTGCQIPGNLLFAVAGSSLGFTSSRGGVVLAFLFMQMHITIAFAIIFFPAFFIMERLVLGLHKDAFSLTDQDFNAMETPEQDKNQVRSAMMSQRDEDLAHINEDYKKSHAYIRVAILRIVMVVIAVIVSVVLKDHFMDLQSFVGASSMALCCMILPLVFYFKTFSDTLPIWEKIFVVLVILITSFLAVYVSIDTGKTLFNPDSAGPNPPVFPFCSAEHAYVVYTNTSHYKPHP